MRCLHVEKPEAGHAVRIVAALELNKKGQRSLVVINKPGLSYLEQLEQAEVWVGQRGGKLAVYTIDLKHLKDSRSEKWKKRQTFRVRDEREKQSVRQLVQVGQRVWAMAEAEEPAVFDLKVCARLSFSLFFFVFVLSYINATRSCVSCVRSCVAYPPNADVLAAVAA
jgi:hypothetical protein